MIKQLFFLLLLVTMTSFAQKVNNPAFESTLDLLLDNSVPQLTVASVKSIDNPIFLDAREKKEYEVSHIKHAQWIGYSDFNINRVKEVNKNRPVIVYCSVGYRSEKIGHQLLAAGFKNVYNLYGGIFEWMNEKQPVFSNKTETPQVHAYDRIWGVWLDRGKKIYN